MSRGAPANGFILVGVVMFVLALTILVLSLFTLSSYEAQSLTQSHARQQGSYDAEGGIEMVKALIMTPPNFSLATASAAVGSYNITNAVAMQHRSNGTWDSTGVVSGDSTVLVRVTSVNYGERRTLQAGFRPDNVRDYYKRLFTVAGSVVVESFELSPPTLHPPSALRLSGMCWQFVDSPFDTLWMALQTDWTGRTFEHTDAVALPNILAYIATHPVDYTAVFDDVSDPNLHTLDFTQHPNGTPVAYYTSPPNPTPGSPFSFQDPEKMVITVKGTVVWIVPKGIRFSQRVDFVKASDPAVLIIVAGANNALPTGPTSDYAVHFSGGFNVAGGGNDHVSLIMVTDSKVVFEFVNEGGQYSGRADQISVLCQDLQLMGQTLAGNKTFTLNYDKTKMDALIEGLYADSSNPLPRPPGSANTLTLVRGSWRSAAP